MDTHAPDDLGVLDIQAMQKSAEALMQRFFDEFKSTTEQAKAFIDEQQKERETMKESLDFYRKWTSVEE